MPEVAVHEFEVGGRDVEILIHGEHEFETLASAIQQAIDERATEKVESR